MTMCVGVKNKNSNNFDAYANGGKKNIFDAKIRFAFLASLRSAFLSETKATN